MIQKQKQRFRSTKRGILHPPPISPGYTTKIAGVDYISVAHPNARGAFWVRIGARRKKDASKV